MSLEMSLVTIVIGMFIGIVSGAPIGYVFGLCCLIFLLITGNPSGLGFVVPASLEFMQGHAFLAVPLYIMIGSLMLETGLSTSLFDFLHSLLGKAKAAFGSALVCFMAIFGAMTGSAAAAIAAVGSLLVPEGPRYGYHKEHITGLIACASLVAMLIPPSVTMVVFGIAAQISIPLLFLATAIPGIITATLFIGVNLVLIRTWMSTSRVEPAAITKVTNRERLWKGIGAWPALILPLIILGGIYGGVFTPTEAAAAAVLWVLLYCLIRSSYVSATSKSVSEFRRGLADLARGFIGAGRIIGAVCVIIFFMFALSRVMIWANVPATITAVFATAIPNKYVFLLVVNIILIIMGMIMDDVSGCLLAGIFLTPVAIHFGVNPVHFGAIVGVNLGLGNLTPPVAPLLYLAAGIGDVQVKLFPANVYTRTVLYLLAFGQLPVLILVTYVPQISLFLPNLWMAAR